MALYRRDLAYVHAEGFETWIRAAAPGLLKTLRRAGVAPGGRVVDLGCGSGLWVARLRRDGYDASGIDASPEMIAPARRRVAGARFQTGTIGRLRRLGPLTAGGRAAGREPRRLPRAGPVRTVAIRP